MDTDEYVEEINKTIECLLQSLKGDQLIQKSLAEGDGNPRQGKDFHRGAAFGIGKAIDQIRLNFHLMSREERREKFPI